MLHARQGATVNTISWDQEGVRSPRNKRPTTTQHSSLTMKLSSSNRGPQTFGRNFMRSMSYRGVVRCIEIFVRTLWRFISHSHRTVGVRSSGLDEIACCITEHICRTIVGFQPCWLFPTKLCKSPSRNHPIESYLVSELISRFLAFSAPFGTFLRFLGDGGNGRSAWERWYR